MTAIDVRAAALVGYDVGLCVLRATNDGLKRPIAVAEYGKMNTQTGRRGAGWERFQAERPDRSTVEAWFANGHAGIGVVCGAISGNLEMLELEGRAVAEGVAAELVKRADAAGIGDVLHRLVDGYYEVTPSGGRHFYYDIDGAPVPHNTKLARRPATGAELAENPDEREKVLIETRGEGGWSVTAPSNGATHPTGKPWVAKAGSFTTIPTITAAEHEALMRVCRSFDQIPPPPPPPPPKARTRASAWSGGSLGESWMDAVEEHLAATTSTAQVLERHGWTHQYDDSHGRQLWCRPGKAEAVSASINSSGRLYVFSTSTPFETGPTTHGLLDVIAMYEHRGDRQAAAKMIAEESGILAAWRSERNHATAGPPPNVNADTGEVARPALVLPAEFWQHPRLAHIRDAAWSRGRAPAAVLGCVIARVAASLDHRYVLPPTVAAVGSLNTGVTLIGQTGSGKSTSAGVADELIKVPAVPGDPSPRGVPLGSGEGIAETYMGSRPATDDEKAAGLAVQGRIREQMRWRELFIGDEGAAIIAQGKRAGATLLETLRTLLTGGTIGQQNAAADNRRTIAAHNYRAAVLLGFQTSTAAELLDDAAGGTPGRFSFVAATDPTIPAPDDRPPWPGMFTVEAIAESWRQSLEHCGGRYLIPVCDTAQRQVLDDDHAVQTGEAFVEAIDAHRNLVRLRVAAHLGRLLDGHPAVTDETWALAGMLGEHSRAVVATIAEHARHEAATRERAMSERHAARAVRAVEKSEAWRTVECAKRIAHKVRSEPGISRSDARRSMPRWRDIFDDGLAHATGARWVTDHREPGQGEHKRTLHPGEVRP